MPACFCNRSLAGAGGQPGEIEGPIRSRDLVEQRATASQRHPHPSQGAFAGINNAVAVGIHIDDAFDLPAAARGGRGSGGSRDRQVAGHLDQRQERRTQE